MLVISNWNTMPMQRELSALKYKTDGAMHHAPKGLKPRPQARHKQIKYNHWHEESLANKSRPLAYLMGTPTNLKKRICQCFY